MIHEPGSFKEVQASVFLCSPGFVLSLSFFAKMRVMCYERYPRFRTFWGPERWSDQLSVSQRPCSWQPPARESHRQPERESGGRAFKAKEERVKISNQLDFASQASLKSRGNGEIWQIS